MFIQPCYTTTISDDKEALLLALQLIVGEGYGIGTITTKTQYGNWVIGKLLKSAGYEVEEVLPPNTPSGDVIEGKLNWRTKLDKYE